MTMRRKEKIIVLVVLAGIVGLGVWLLYAWLYLLPEKAIERELAKIRARGEPVTLEELAPPEIPDAENAAKIYEQAFGLYYEPPGEEGRKLSDISGKDLANWTEEDIIAIREYVEKNEDCLSLIFEAANYDKCRFDIDYSVAPPWDIRLPHLSKMRSCARLLARDALLKAREGKTDEALESIRAGLRTGKALLDEPLLISQLVRIAIGSLMFTTSQRILDEDDASPEILRRLLEELDIEESREGYTKAFQGERCAVIYLFEAVIKDPALLAQIGGGLQSSAAGKGYRIVGALGKPVLRRDEVFAIGLMRRMIEAVKLPYHQAKNELDKIDQDLDNAPFYRILSKMFLRPFTGSHLTEARHEARIGLAQLALALKIYKAEKGKYPDSLSELVPEILSQLPQDPFTGKDFVYKKEGEGFLVYSLGENGTDEGGLEPNDIPWRCKR